MLKLVLNMYKGVNKMRLIVDGRINADTCSVFGIYILEKNLPEKYRQRLYNKLLALCEK